MVTAQKRTESLQDVPISVTAFSSEAIQNMEFLRTDDIANMTPNLEWTAPYGSSGGNVFLRGVGNDVFFANATSGIGIFTDEVYLNSKSVNLFALFDIERVEVVRGPQNTLYGRNSTGGAVNFISRKPRVEDGSNARLEMTYGRFNQFDVDIAAGTALSDHVAVRAAFNVQSRDGLFDNQTLGIEESDIEKYSGRAQLAWDVTDNIDVLLNIHGGLNRGENRRPKSIGISDPNNPGGPFAANPCPVTPKLDGGVCSDAFGAVEAGGFTDVFANEPNPLEDIDAYGGFANISWEFAGFTVTSITAYEGNEKAAMEDSDGATNFFGFHTVSEADQITQEIRITSTGDGPLQWISGFYYLHEDLESFQTSLNRLPGRGTGTLLNQDTDSWAVFGQASYAMTESWKFTGGLRYTEETKEGTLLGRNVAVSDANLPPGTLISPNNWFSLPQLPNGPGFLLGTRSETFDETWEEIGWKVGLDFQVTNDALLYASVSRGFNTGVIETAPRTLLSMAPLFGGPQIPFIVEPEFLLAYEIGVKTTWLNGALQLNAAIFRNEFDDQQVNQVVNGEVVLRNAAESTIDGAEIELQWIPADGWFVNLGLGILDSEFDQFDFGGGTDFSGNKLPNIPDVSFNGLVRKEWNLGNGVASLQTNFNYLDSIYSNDPGNNPLLREPGNWTVNARGAYEFGPDGRYEIAAWGKNILDDEQCAYRFDFSFLGFVECFTRDPATYGVTASVRFD